MGTQKKKTELEFWVEGAATFHRNSLIERKWVCFIQRKLFIEKKINKLNS